MTYTPRGELHFGSLSTGFPFCTMFVPFEELLSDVELGRVGTRSFPSSPTFGEVFVFIQVPCKLFWSSLRSLSLCGLVMFKWIGCLAELLPLQASFPT